MTFSSSIDHKEIVKFNKTHQEWWDTNGEFRILHDITPLRLEYITSHISQHLLTQQLTNKEIEILDVGCGGGLISFPLSKGGFRVTGLDANECNYQACMDKLSSNDFNENLNFIYSTVDKHLSLKKKYDVVICLEVIEHVADISFFLSSITDLLKDGGILILSTLNRTLKSYALAIGVAEYLFGWVPKGTHQYQKFLKPSEIVSLCNELSMKLVDLTGMSFDLVKQEWRLSIDVDVNYFLTLQKNYNL